MRNRAIKRPKWENLESRYDYMFHHPACQFGEYVFDECNRLSQDPHHIFGRGWVGCDDPRNLIAACRNCHNATENYRDGYVWSLYVKLKTNELDLDFLSAGWRRSVRGTLETWMLAFERKFTVEMAKEILESTK